MIFFSYIIQSVNCTMATRESFDQCSPLIVLEKGCGVLKISHYNYLAEYLWFHILWRKVKNLPKTTLLLLLIWACTINKLQADKNYSKLWLVFVWENFNFFFVFIVPPYFCLSVTLEFPIYYGVNDKARIYRSWHTDVTTETRHWRLPGLVLHTEIFQSIKGLSELTNLEIQNWEGKMNYSQTNNCFKMFHLSFNENINITVSWDTCMIYIVYKFGIQKQMPTTKFQAIQVCEKWEK